MQPQVSYSLQGNLFTGHWSLVTGHCKKTFELQSKSEHLNNIAMSTKTLDLKELQMSVTELLSLIQADEEIIITEGNTPVALLTVLNPVTTKIPSESGKTPQPGLNLGAMKMSNDFDQPLSDDFWLQNP
jgi:antitoxin (DNA-binding transcriptional repressor) of toxin-antitoxin stability system